MSGQMKGLPAETDFVVIGAGIAGLRAAIELAGTGRVLVLAKKDPLLRSPAHTISDEDEVTLHLQDTLTAGDGLCNPAAAKTLVENGIERIEELLAWASHGERNGTKLVFGPESGHSRGRVLIPRASPREQRFCARCMRRRTP